jgi:hypothetical protein
VTILNAFVSPEVGLLAVDTEVRGRPFGKSFPIPHLRGVLAFRGSMRPAGHIALAAHDRGLEFDEFLEKLPVICAHAQRLAIDEGDLIAPKGLECVLVGYSPRAKRVIGLRVYKIGTGSGINPPAADAPFETRPIEGLYIPVPVALPALLKPRCVDEMVALGRSQIGNARRLMAGTEHAGGMPGGPFVVAEITRTGMNIQTFDVEG